MFPLDCTNPLPLFFFKRTIFKITWLGYKMIRRTLFRRGRELRMEAGKGKKKNGDISMWNSIRHTRVQERGDTPAHTNTVLIKLRCDNNALGARGGIQSQLSLLQFKSSFSSLLIGCERDRRESWFVPAFPLIWERGNAGMCVCVRVFKRYKG